MINKRSITVILAIFLLLVSCSKEDKNSLTVYAYDSFCSSWGAGPAIAEEYEKKTGVRINLVSCGSASELTGRLALEKTNCKADVVIGISNTGKTDKNMFLKWEPECKKDLIDYDENMNLIPFDWGILAFNAFSDCEQCPTSLKELTDPEFKDQFILIDPRTSAVGLGMFIWTVRVFGEKDALLWWNKATNNALTVADSWSSAYGLFSQKEAPMVISYSTSPVYHRTSKDGIETKVLEFSDGHLRTVEYLGIVNSSSKKNAAEAFCNYVLQEGQKSIAISNTMLPANMSVILPDSFEDTSSFKVIGTDFDNDFDQIDKLLNKWSEAVIN